MNLIIDVGNTAVKLAVFDDGTLIRHAESTVNEFVEKAKKLYLDFPTIGATMVSSVVDLERNVLNTLSGFSRLHLLDHSTLTPFKNEYASPETLGVDRIALATAAFYHNPKGNTLVIDAGTCITFDMITDQGAYVGGAISPGLAMRYYALNAQTSKLPLLEIEPPKDLIGNTTSASIHSGVINGICAEIDGIIERYSSRYEDLTVILTGGDSLFLSKRLKNTIFAHSKFLLEGLNYLLDYNKR